ncbi:very-long-chain 3-oxoacyl-CoA reductase-B-like isoform X2 [Cavia porcellus]|uniref:very-long-chain 3-oxoacyl-CoA reductase-B-like isoform X2 n=1 Tax=Cavia porcellus TaxID=10141 RepID=UPI0006618B1D|nr:very-long-chain 3-oxoacyl-CoA reductase-B-like isoform X1 [Cavia porcellus]
MESKWDALSTLGAITAAWLLLRGTWGVARAVYVYLLPQVRRGNAWLRAQGAWAVVTGATSGIGKAYAHELARRGLDIVLISRSHSKLEQEAREIERLHGRSTRIIQADFTGGLEIYGAIEAGLRGLEIGVLVNNVAMMYGGGASTFRKLLDLEDLGQSVSDIINCNVMSVAQMVRIVLPQMVSRGKGIIINVSSVTDCRSTPFLSLYSATKAFVRTFSEAVCAEYFPQGVTIQTVSPVWVSTNMTSNGRTSRLVKDADEFAQEALDTLGLSSHVSGCLKHAVQSFLLPFILPAWLLHSRWVISLLSAGNKSKLFPSVKPRGT